MTYQSDCTLPEELLEQIAQEGLASLPTLIQMVVNQAMQIERQKHLGVGPYERSEERQGHANGYKPKTVATRVGNILNTYYFLIRRAIIDTTASKNHHAVANGQAQS